MEMLLDVWLADDPEGEPLSEIVPVRMVPTPKQRYWKSDKWFGIHAKQRARYVVLKPSKLSIPKGFAYFALPNPVDTGDITAWPPGHFRIRNSDVLTGSLLGLL